MQLALVLTKAQLRLFICLRFSRPNPKSSTWTSKEVSVESCHELTKTFDPCPAGDITHSYGLWGFSPCTKFQVFFYVLFKKGLSSFLYYAPQGKSQRQLSTQSYDLETAWRASAFLRVPWAEEPPPCFLHSPSTSVSAPLVPATITSTPSRVFIIQNMAS